MSEKADEAAHRNYLEWRADKEKENVEELKRRLEHFLEYNIPGVTYSDCLRISQFAAELFAGYKA